MGQQMPAPESQHVLELSNVRSFTSETSLLRPKFIVVHTLCFLHYRHAALGYHRTDGHLLLSSVAIRYCTTLSQWRTRASFFSGACSPKTALHLGSALSARSTPNVTPQDPFPYENVSATKSDSMSGRTVSNSYIHFRSAAIRFKRLSRTTHHLRYIRQGDFFVLQSVIAVCHICEEPHRSGTASSQTEPHLPRVVSSDCVSPQHHEASPCQCTANFDSSTCCCRDTNFIRSVQHSFRLRG